MKKLPVVPTLIAFFCIVILLKLGFWQLGRAEEKREIANQLVAKQVQIYASLMDALNDAGEDNYKSVFLTGQVNNGQLFYWDNRVVQGKVGYEVLAVVKSDAGNILVNFGWVEDKSFRQVLPQVELPAHVYDEKVVLHAPSKNLLIKQSFTGELQWPLIIQEPDFEKIQRVVKQDLLPFLAYAENSEDYGLKNNFRPITMSPEKHIGYAIQWFSLAVACFVIYLLAHRKKLAETDPKSDSL